MSRYVIPLPPSDGRAIRLRPLLSGTRFRLVLEYNVRDDSWFLRLADAGGAPIAAGIRGVADYSLTDRISDPRKPAGTLILIDTSGKGVDPGRLDLGRRVQLIYDDGV